MYRLVRKFRARVKTQEIIFFGATMSFAIAIGCITGQWYHDAGRDLILISRVNAVGGTMEAASAPDGTGGEAGGRNAYDLFAERNDDVASGFYSSQRSGILPPDSSYAASYLSLLGEASVAGSDDAIYDGSGEQRGDGDDLSRNPEAGSADDNKEVNNDYIPEANPDSKDTMEKPLEGVSDLPEYTVKVIYNGDRHVFKTESKRVADLFAERGIVLTPDDKIIGAYLDGIINSDLYIEIKRITQKTVVEEIVIPARTVYRDNAEITDGKSKIIRNGSDGLKRVEYVITYENGIQVSKNVAKEEIITEAVSSIIEQGSTGTRLSKDGVEFTYSGVIDVKCTAYTSSYEDTGKRPGDPAFGITKSGTVAREGIVAVDPSVIPLGTKMYIDILDDAVEDYGFAIAEDTGGKIKGKKVDLYFDATRDELIAFGVRKAKVYIID